MRSQTGSVFYSDVCCEGRIVGYNSAEHSTWGKEEAKENLEESLIEDAIDYFVL